MTPILQVSHLSKSFRIGRKKSLKALRDVSFSLSQGTVTCLVGESGSGKTTLANLLLRLILPDSGEIFYKGIPVVKAEKETLNFLRREMQAIFQNPYLSFNPRIKIKTAFDNVLKVAFRKMKPSDRFAAMEALLQQVNLPVESVQKYPSQFSGGQQQRLAIARALAPGPRLLVADEPVSSLDASNKKQVLALLQKLQREKNLTVFLISHDLRAVRQIADFLLVLYAGELVEMVGSAAFFSHAAHPYSRALLDATPRLGAGKETARIFLAGDPPDLTQTNKGCIFAPRCPRATPVCFSESPGWQTVDAAHQVRCHFPVV